MAQDEKNPSSSGILFRLWPAYVILFTSFAGLLDAGYLAYKFYAKTALKCVLGESCDTVTGSAYSSIGGVPISLLGSVFYLVVFILAILITDGRKYRLIVPVFYLSAAAFAVSLVLVYIQLFVLHAICVYCMTSAALSTAIFFLSLYSYPRTKKIKI